MYRKKIEHYYIPCHAHELTFSCYHKCNYLLESEICEIFIEELCHAKDKYAFKLWAYVLMPNHVHLLIYPENESYSISDILQYIKGRSSSKYGKYIRDNKAEILEQFCVISKGKMVFRLWQPGGGFDRNLWSAQAIHNSILYIEGNPVRAGLVQTPEEWMWSSAWAKIMKPELISDFNDVPVLFI